MILENTLTEKAKNELNKIKEIAKTVDRKNLFMEQMSIHIVLEFFEE